MALDAVAVPSVPIGPVPDPATRASASAAAAPAGVATRPRGDADHLRALFVQTPATLIGYLLGAGVITWLFWALAPSAQMLGWLGALAVLWFVRLAHYLRFLRNPRADDATLLKWRRSWRVLVLLQGSLWGVAGWMFWGLGTPYQRLALILVVYSYCVSSVQLLATQPKVFLGFITLVFAPAIVRIASDTTQPGHVQLAVIATILFCSTVLMVRTFGNALGLAISLKARTDELAARLRQEMTTTEEARKLAEDARRAAEAASQAKTQFFAAASHDLRQPLHAMGLFAEALRQKSRDPEVASLVNSINESVDALEGLFGELLDITRIDTGGVDVHPAPVRLRELFARLRLHFEPIAFEKGLMLSFHGEQHVAQADPVLIERVLRNLVSNAIRYTDDGGVIVSARLRGGTYNATGSVISAPGSEGGARLLLQVWDSGIGIAESALPRIFDEFYQVQSNKPLEAHHRKGLGLGLAIVKRLAGLMGAPISVRSRVGHGTVFSLEVPVGRAPRTFTTGISGPSTQTPLGLTLEGRLFVVVEDEAAVREGLVVLLQAWGARVVAFESIEGLRHWLQAPAAEAPDLMLVDYRLQEGHTGIEALVAVRSRFATAAALAPGPSAPGGERRIPAILITGSSLVGHEDEAITHDYHLLIKPVLPGKLRAMIAFKLGMRGGGGGA
ncbi:MAG: hybrid sensor histidine kinase/response regulator [Burkholderiales bacterium]|nr:hybrid sensor histidine kinase/response regulator [Burkholderiales bacterium]